MSFFRDVCFYKKHLTNKINSNKPSLRVVQPDEKIESENSYLFRNFGKRAFSFISRRRLKASMTLEASLVLPIFLFAVLSLISIFDIVKIKGCMDIAVAEAGNEIALESYGGYVGDLLTPLYINYKIHTFLNKNLSESDVEKISKYIFVTDISFWEEENILMFRVDYSVTPDFGFLGLNRVKLHTMYYGHNWKGYTAKKDAETMVYISHEASVYHTDKECPYLNIEIKEVSFSDIDNLRNDSRHIYYKCNLCDELENSGVVYITSEGKNYHNIDNCIGLKRSIYTVPLSLVSYKKVCSRCGE